MISPITIERIRSAANIVDVVSEYVTLRRAGSSYRGLCPFHDDTTPSFSVSPARGICKCFACGEGGDVVHFIMKQEQLGYYDALRFLAKKYGIEVEERELTPEERRSQSERESMFVLNEWASNYFHEELLHSEEGQTIGLAYFRSRGFRDDIIEKFRLGFSPSASDMMSKAALKEGYKEEYLVKTGLSFKRDNGTLYDKYHGRVIFPWFSISGKIVGFGGRVLDARTKGVNQKYINSAESEIYHKAKELYGLYQAKKAISKEHNVFMVEGYTDVISMHQCGIENVVANSGTALSEDQISILHRFTNNITLLYDGDAAGQKAALRGTDMLLARGMRIKILLLPDNDDPDSFARKHSATEFREYVESHQVDFISFKTNLLLNEAQGDPDKMSDLIRSIVESIAVVPEEIERSVYMHKCSDMLQIDEKMLIREVMKTRKRNWDQKLREKEQAEQRKRYLENGLEPSAEDAEPATDASSNSSSSSPSPSSLSSQSSSRPSSGVVGASFEVSPEEQRFYDMEQVIIQTIVRSGEQLLSFHRENNEPLTIMVIDYIFDELSAAGLTFHHPLYARMLNTAHDAAHETDFVASRFFLNSADEAFSQTASRLISNSFDLPASGEQNEEKVSSDSVIRIVLEYKSLVVNAEMTKVMTQLSNPLIMNNTEQYMQLLQRQMELTKEKKELAKQLGDRVVLK
ncbi:MAG: DNA primase [Bacteroidaceae bacterium]|nr:DNA primase [Bacteroidaceae bacterium]